MCAPQILSCTDISSPSVETWPDCSVGHVQTTDDFGSYKETPVALKAWFLNDFIGPAIFKFTWNLSNWLRYECRKQLPWLICFVFQKRQTDFLSLCSSKLMLRLVFILMLTLRRQGGLGSYLVIMLGYFKMCRPNAVGCLSTEVDAWSLNEPAR